MNTVFVFTTSGGQARTEILGGVREFFSNTDWNIQSFEFEGKPFPVRELIRFWSPIGCIVEGSGNGLTPRTLPKGGFGSTPIVYIGCNPILVPEGATCVIHDARTAAEFATRELLYRHDIRQFAFVGHRDHAWSERRKAAFMHALQLNGKSAATLDLTSPPSTSRRREFVSLQKWLIGLEKPCGLFAASDAIAESVLAICRISSIAVPDDLAVIGVDDDEYVCNHTKPTLTSVRPDFRQAGRFSARLLARKILKAQNVPAETLFRSSGITRRGSTRALFRADAEVAAALERIHAPNGVALSPGEILSAFPCSRRNAEIRFRRATGHSVLDELMSARIEQAKSLLLNTTLPVGEIAVSCGYRFPAHFITAFRQSTGHTPLKWRKLAPSDQSLTACT